MFCPLHVGGKNLRAPENRSCVKCKTGAAISKWAVCELCHTKAGKSLWYITFEREGIALDGSSRTNHLRFTSLRTGLVDVEPLAPTAIAIIAHYAKAGCNPKWRYGVTKTGAEKIIAMHNKEIGTPILKLVINDANPFAGVRLLGSPPPQPSSPPQETDILECLGINSMADYTRWCMRNHPDKVPSKDADRATDVFKRVSVAVGVRFK